MSTDPKTSGGSNQDASGDLDQNQSNPNDKKDSVSYDTHRKLLGEKKRKEDELAAAQSKLADLEKKELAREEAEAAAKGDLQKLINLRDEKLKVLEEENTKIKTSLSNGQKLRSFLDGVSGEVDEQYWNLIDLKGIVIDPATGMPDETSVKKVVSAFEQKYSLVIRKADGPKLPNGAAQGGGTKLTYNDWLALPADEKKKRMKDVDKTTL